MQASEEGSNVKYKQTAPRGRSPAEALLEADVARLLKYRRQQKKQSSNAFGNLLLTEMRRAVLRPSCSPMRSSVEKRADWQTASLVIHQPLKNCGLVILSHIRYTLAS